MATNVSMAIGPSGQEPSTAYTHVDGVVTLAARAATTRTVQQLASIVASIELFVAAAASGGRPPGTPPAPPLLFRVQCEDEAPDLVTARYRCAATNGQNLVVDATIDRSIGMITFDARPERTVAWGDFEAFAGWMRKLYEFSRR